MEEIIITASPQVAPIVTGRFAERPAYCALQPHGTRDYLLILILPQSVFRGNIAPSLGQGDAIGDPRFVKPSRDSNVADFHQRFRSPAVGKGQYSVQEAFLDLDGKPRQIPPTLGAYER